MLILYQSAKFHLVIVHAFIIKEMKLLKHVDQIDLIILCEVSFHYCAIFFVESFDFGSFSWFVAGGLDLLLWAHLFWWEESVSIFSTTTSSALVTDEAVVAWDVRCSRLPWLPWQSSSRSLPSRGWGRPRWLVLVLPFLLIVQILCFVKKLTMFLLINFQFVQCFIINFLQFLLIFAINLWSNILPLRFASHFVLHSLLFKKVFIAGPELWVGTLSLSLNFFVAKSITRGQRLFTYFSWHRTLSIHCLLHNRFRLM